jgi:hypothetical protein
MNDNWTPGVGRIIRVTGRSYVGNTMDIVGMYFKINEMRYSLYSLEVNGFTAISEDGLGVFFHLDNRSDSNTKRRSHSKYYWEPALIEERNNKLKDIMGGV